MKEQLQQQPYNTSPQYILHSVNNDGVTVVNGCSTSADGSSHVHHQKKSKKKVLFKTNSQDSHTTNVGASESASHTTADYYHNLLNSNDHSDSEDELAILNKIDGIHARISSTTTTTTASNLSNNNAATSANDSANANNDSDEDIMNRPMEIAAILANENIRLREREAALMEAVRADTIVTLLCLIDVVNINCVGSVVTALLRHILHYK